MDIRELTPEEKARAREAYNAYKREWYRKNKEHVAEYQRNYYKRRPKKRKEKTVEEREAYNAYKREYYRKNKEKLKEYLQDYRMKKKVEQQNGGEGK